MKEQLLQRQIINYLQKRGWAIVTIQSSKRGTPDILGCIDGRFIAIEVKAPGKLNTLKPIQTFQLNAINDAGGIAFAADSLETVKKYIK